MGNVSATFELSDQRKGSQGYYRYLDITVTCTDVDPGWQYKPFVFAGDGYYGNHDNYDLSFFPPYSYEFSGNNTYNISIIIHIPQDTNTYYATVDWTAEYIETGQWEWWWTNSYYFSFNGHPPLQKWSWSNDSGSWNNQYGNASYNTLQRAENAIKYGGKTTQFDHVVWNDLVYWIKSLLEGLNYSTSGENYILMSDDDKILTAQKWNNLKNWYDTVIGQIGGTYLPSKNKGDIVYGSLFLDLVDNINDNIS